MSTPYAKRSIWLPLSVQRTTDHESTPTWQHLRYASSDALVALRDEARVAGDLAQVKLCEAALAGDPDALTECVEVIREARRLAEERLTEAVLADVASGRICDCTGVGCQSCDPHDEDDPDCPCVDCSRHARGLL